MKQLLKELSIFIVIFTIAAGVIMFYLVKQIEVAQRFDSFTGEVEKKEIRIASIGFGTIESLPINEGKFVKEGETLAVLRLASAKEGSEASNSANGLYEVTAPADGIVSKILLAEKSNIKPEVEYIVLYPISATLIKFNVPKLSNIKNYSKFYITDDSLKEDYQIGLLDTLPVDTIDDDTRSYFANFAQGTDSKNFYNKETITIKAIKTDEATPWLVKIVDRFIQTLGSSFNKYIASNFNVEASK